MPSFLNFAAGAGLLVCATAALAQPVRRAAPVPQPTATVPLEIRRAVPVNPVTPSPSATPTPTPPPPPPTAVPIPAVRLAPASANDTAHFLAGLPVSANSSLLPLTRESAWQQHATFFNQAWAWLEETQLSGLRTWETTNLPEARGPLPVVYYLFSGPDYLYADQFFPNASTYILAGTEPIGPLPDVTRLAGPALDPALHGLQASLNSVLRFSFFITKDMKTDLEHEELKGTLPIFYVFLARAGKTITDITFLTLDEKGDPHIAGPGTPSRTATPGVRISFRGAPASAVQTLYYFTTDLSDEGIRARPGFLKFCTAQNVGMSLLKSASYLMFEPGFETVRNFLLTHSSTLIQDDSGIPITAFDPAKWDLRLFGSYSGPIDIFKQHFQPELQALYSQSQAPPLGFGIGYRWNRSASTVIVARHK